MHGSFLRRCATGLAAVAVLASISVVGSPPAGASIGGDALFFASRSSSTVVGVGGGRHASLTAFPTRHVLAGHFTNRSGAQAFLYNPGSDPDGLVDVAPDGDGIDVQLALAPVSGTYRPFVADFDGNGRDDIFWYAPGRATDYLWYFETDGTITSTKQTVRGRYRPIPIEIERDGKVPRAAILWYSPGTGTDVWWNFDGRTSTSRLLRIDGSYEPVVGRFLHRSAADNGEQILFYDRSGGRNYLWTPARNTGALRSEAAVRPGPGYLPVVFDGGMVADGRDGVFWYGPGSNPEKLALFVTPTKTQGGNGTTISSSWRVLRDAQGRSAAEEIVFLSDGTTARTLEMAPESAPPFGTFTTITGLPKAPVGARTSYLLPV